PPRPARRVMSRAMLVVRAVLFCCVATWAAAANGQTNPPSGQTNPPSGQTNRGDVSEEEIKRALEADTAAQRKAQGNAAPSGTPANGAAPNAAALPGAAGPSGNGGWGAVGRFFQSLNPDISGIVDFTAGWFSDDDGTIKSGDDPQSTGFKVQEVE